MSVTIDSLDIQIRSSSGSAAANIDRLAESLRRLRENAKLTTVTNNLQRLSTALSSLQISSTSLSSLRGLAGAMKALASVQKSAGLNSILNSLRRLPEIVSQLDPSTIIAFSSAMRSLAVALRPLATELERVGTAFSRLPARIQQIVTATDRLSRNLREASEEAEDLEINVNSLNFANFVTGLQAVMSALQGVRDQMVAFISDAIEWDGIQFRFGRAFGEDADMVMEYVDKVTSALHINKQQFMQYSSLYGSLLSGFGMEQEKVTTISIGLTELSYDIWASYNDRYKTLEDASEAVRSAITGEIEPIRNAGIALTEASMQEYLDNLGLAHVRMANLSEAQKAQVRYAVMVNSAMNQGIVGTYAAEMVTAEGAVRTLSQQMKTLGQAIGSLFIPILTAVIPWISAFAEVLYDAIAAVANFFGIPFFKIDWGNSATAGLGSGLEDVAAGAEDASSALGDAGKAAKKLKDYTMGFDELNIIEPPSPSSSGGGGAGGAGEVGASDWEGLDLDTLWDDSVLAKASEQIDSLKQKILDFFGKWKTEIAIISGALAGLTVAGLLTKLGTALQWGEKFLGVMSTIKKLASTAIVITLSFALTKASFASFMSEDGSFWDYVKGLLIGGAASWILYSMWGPGGLAIGFAVTAVASLSAVIENGGINSAESATVALTGLASAAAAVWLAWKKLVPALANSALADSIRAIVGAFRGSSAASSALTFMFPTLTKIATALSSAAKAVAGFVAGISAPVWGIIVAVIAAIASVTVFLARNWDKVKEAVQKFFKENIVPKLESMKESWEEIKEALSPAVKLFEKIAEPVKRLAKSFGEWWDKIKPLKVALGWLGDALEFLGGVIFALLTGALAGAFSTTVSIIKGFIQTFSGIIQIVSGVVSAVVALFKGDWEQVWESVKDIGSGIADVFIGLYDMTIGGIVNFVKGVIDWFVALWDELVGHSIVPDTVDAIVEWFLSLPDKIFGPIKEFTEGIVEFFEDMWSDIQDWWNSKAAPKFTSKYWKDKFDTIREAIASKLSDAKKAASDKWNEVKNWFSTNVAPKFTVSYWKNKFDAIRGGLSAKLDEAKKAVTDKWGEIKNWFSSNIAPKFTKDYWVTKFGGIKEGLIQAIKNGINGAVDKINSFINWLNSHLKISLPAVTVAGKEIFEGASFQVVTIPNIPKFADGGFIEDGLFTMNQGEIAGKFSNGKSVVANNQMIVDGIAAGVYSAVLAAMSESNSGNSQAVNVYLDGKQIYTSIKKTEADRGVSLMGNQLGYAY